MSPRDLLQPGAARDYRNRRDFHVLRAATDLGRPLLARDRDRHDPAGLDRFVFSAGRPGAARRRRLRLFYPRRVLLRARLVPHVHSPSASPAHLRHVTRRHNFAQHRRLQHTRPARIGFGLDDPDLLRDLYHGACRTATDHDRSTGASGVRDDPRPRSVHRRDADGHRLVQIPPRLSVGLVFHDRVS